MSDYTLIRPILDMNTRLCDIPTTWLKYIEPKIMRMGEHWYWQGTIDKGRYPMVYMPQRKKLVNAKHFVARMFWDFPDTWFVINGPERVCSEDRCLRPGHLNPIATNPRWINRDW